MGTEALHDAPRRTPFPVTRFILGAAGAIGFILFTAFVTSRLVRSRTAGMSLRMQIFLALASVIGAFSLGLGLLVLDRVEARATLLAESAAREEAMAIAAFISGELDVRGGSLADVARKVEAIRGNGAGDLHLAVLNPKGDEVFSRGLQPSEPGTVVMTAPIVVNNTEVGQLRVVKPTLLIKRVLTDMAPAILLLSTLLGSAAAAAAALIGRVLGKPIELLTEFAVFVSEGKRDAAPPPVHGRELNRLSKAVDSMRRQLEGRPFVETFAADLSHELKNPVAAIRASAEVLADGALSEPEEALRFVKRINEAATRIEAMLGELLSLARIEARGVEQADPVDLGDLAKKAVSRAKIKDPEASILLSAPSFARVRGDALWLSRAIDNLIDNALIHGKREQPITLNIERAPGHLVVSVRNAGSIGRHVAKNLFKRFVTTRADRGGTGLGLAIVKAVAEAHGGSATCPLTGPKEVEFRMTLPLP